ncbi:hypothetical protein [Sphingomicrobium aestuariivivum]|uniref:hypothetical protein n=1 Tax=Sphingomicrobium aestuariivivum TaxID=1582356 RepID=UPI001FD7236B|nr:hypothetical protein [Sphingomicrobium aestuariivivum]MCJ8189785.1 hypothetical protein [Sphingomicrobium aestuariivivum]
MAQEPQKPNKNKFIILVDGVYYMTTGALLTYDMKVAEGLPPGPQREEKIQGVKDVKKKFQDEVVSEHTAYVAVGFETPPPYNPVNTGTSG